MLEAFNPSIKKVGGCDGEVVITISLQRVKQLSRVLRGNGGRGGGILPPCLAILRTFL